jgi:predicted nucleic-acid-binding protein
MIMADVHFDTSVVMRFLVGMPLSQFRLAARYLDHLRDGGGSAWVSDLVLSEAYIALQQYYDLSKADALAALNKFARLPGIHVIPHALATLSLPSLASAKPGFVDRLIHGQAVEAGQTLVTFEKAAKNLTATVVLGH